MARASVALLIVVMVTSTAHAQRSIVDDRSGTWVKVCDKHTLLPARDKDGKQEKKALLVCMMLYERIDPVSGMLVFSAAVHDTTLDGKDTRHLRVTVPLNMLLTADIHTTLVPKDAWERVAQDRKLDESDKPAVKQLKLTYTHCHASGCVAEVEATPEIVTNLKASGGLLIQATTTVGTRLEVPIPMAIQATLKRGGQLAVPVPLAGFAEALAGGPLPLAEYRKWRGRTERTQMRCDQGNWPGCTRR